MRFAQSLIEIANEDCAVQTKGIRTWIIPILSRDCVVEAGKQRRRFEPVIDLDLS